MGEPEHVSGPARRALQHLTAMQAKHEAEVIADAVGFILVTVDLDNGTVTYNGFWTQPAPAFAAAEAHEAELNKLAEGNDLGFRVRVAPVSGFEGAVSLT